MTKRPVPRRKSAAVQNLTQSLSIINPMKMRRIRIVIEVDVIDHNVSRSSFNEDVVNMVNEFTNETGTTAVYLTTEEVEDGRK